MTKVGFIGLGQMGSRMVRNLAKAGHDVTAYDVRSEAVSALAPAGVRGHREWKGLPRFRPFSAPFYEPGG